MRTFLPAAAAALLLLAGPLSAQEPYRASYYLYPLKGPNDATALVLHYQYAQNADYTDKVPFARSFSAEAGINASGSRFAVARFKAPRLADGWRLYAEAGLGRERRFGYFGVGNDTEEAGDATLRDSPYYDRVRRDRTYGRLDITRRLVGPLHLTVGGQFVDASFGALPGSSHFRDDFFTVPPCLPEVLCAGAPGDPGDQDVTGRAALILDTRDSELVPSSGILAELGGEIGSGGSGYAGVFAVLSGYVPPWYGAVIAGRIVYRALDAEAPLDARYSLTAWERAIPLVGGPGSHRSFVYGRYVGRKALVANLDFRQDILNFGDFGAITGVAFLDAARVEEDALLDSNDLHVGGGLGLALRILRSTVLQFNFATGGDGYRFSMGTGWAF